MYVRLCESERTFVILCTSVSSKGTFKLRRVLHMPLTITEIPCVSLKLHKYSVLLGAWSAVLAISLDALVKPGFKNGFHAQNLQRNYLVFKHGIELRAGFFLGYHCHFTNLPQWTSVDRFMQETKLEPASALKTSFLVVIWEFASSRHHIFA